MAGILSEEWIKNQDILFFKKEIAWMEKSLSKVYAWYEDAARRDIDYWFRQAYLEYGGVEKAEKRLQWYKKRIRQLKSGVLNNAGISDEDIQRAREYSWDNLLEFSKGKAFCPFHNDVHNPNFSVKGGRGRCWACGWAGDSIDFICERDGLTFVDAVKFLSGGE